MKTYTINSQEDLNEFKNDLGYKVDGNLKINCILSVDESIEAVGYIESGGSIKSVGFIEERSKQQ